MRKDIGDDKVKKNKTQTDCTECMYYEYDEEYDCYSCVMNLDQDEAEYFISYSACPFFRFGNEYTIVRKQN